MSRSELLGKLRQLSQEIEATIQILNSSSALSLPVDDEYEAEYLLDSLQKTSKKLHGIISSSMPSVDDQPNANLQSESNKPCDDRKESPPNGDSFCPHPMKKSSHMKSLLISSDSETDDEGHAVEKDDIDEDHCLTKKAGSELHDERLDNGLDISSDGTASLSDPPTPSVLDMSADVTTEIDPDNVDEFLRDIDFDEDFDVNEGDTAQETVPKESLSQSECDDDEDEDDNCDNQPTDKKYLDILKKYFGYAKFRPLQWKIINSVLNDKRDNCVVMATGYGKSLCYQYPSVFTGKTTVVVSPLISLMEDQVLSLSTVNIASCLLGSAQQNMVRTKDELLHGVYRVVYVTPEFIHGDSGDLLQQLNKNVGIDLIAIDEAHCVSQWGHDFRAAYRELGKIRRILPKVPVMALTATATPEVRKDICRCLSLRRPLITCTGFDRPNLFLSVSVKSGDTFKDLRSQMTRVDDRWTFDGSTIVYCQTKKAAESLANSVKLLGCTTAVYHAGLPLAQRKQTHRQFINDEIQVIVATVAFGMGIDKHDVRRIIHYGAPKDIESYYQEIGRAGRDGLNSSCHVFYNTGDFNTSRFLLKDIRNPTFLKHKQLMLRKMEDYLRTANCRRRAILAHFEDSKNLKMLKSERCCDNCTLRKLASMVDENAAGRDAQLIASFGKNTKIDYGKEAKELLNAIEVMGGSFGLGTCVFFVRGSTSQRVPDRFKKMPGYGDGKYRTEKWWKVFGQMLITEDYLEEFPVPGGFGSTVDLSETGQEWLRKARLSDSNRTLMLYPNHELLSIDRDNTRPTLTLASKTILPSVPVSSWCPTKHQPDTLLSRVSTDPKDEKLRTELYAKLIDLRNNLSKELNLHTYMIFSNKCLLDMAQCRPTSVDSLIELEDIADQKAQKYGHSFVKCIKDFCQEHEWSHDVQDDQTPRDCAKTESSPNAVSQQTEMVLQGLAETVRISYTLYEVDHKSLATVAASRGFKTSTIASHLADCIRAGLSIDIERLGVTEDVKQRIINVIRRPPINSDISKLTPIKEQLPDEITYEHIKIVIAILQRCYGVTADAEPDFITTSAISVANMQRCSQPFDKAKQQQSSSQQVSRQQSQSSNKSPAAHCSKNSSNVQTNKLPECWLAASKSQAKSKSSDDQGHSKRKIPDWMTGPKDDKTVKKKSKGGLFS